MYTAEISVSVNICKSNITGSDCLRIRLRSLLSIRLLTIVHWGCIQLYHVWHDLEALRDSYTIGSFLAWHLNVARCYLLSVRSQWGGFWQRQRLHDFNSRKTQAHQEMKYIHQAKDYIFTLEASIEGNSGGICYSVPDSSSPESATARVHGWKKPVIIPMTLSDQWN